MQNRSRIQGGVDYANKSKSEKLSKILNTFIFSYVGVFILVQIATMVLVILDLVTNQSFLAEFNATATFLIIPLNANMTVFYCRNSGRPYIDQKARKKVHIFSFVVSVWTVAFIGRFIFSFTNIGLILYETEDVSDSD